MTEDVRKVVARRNRFYVTRDTLQMLDRPVEVVYPAWDNEFEWVSKDRDDNDDDDM
jgi:hypothetical protein